MAIVTREKKSNHSGNRKRKTTRYTIPETWAPTHEQIARLAYQIWQERGQTHGQDLEDWLKAEEQLRHELDRF